MSAATHVHVSRANSDLTRQAADEGASAVSLAPRPAERVQLLDQSRNFGGVEEFRNVVNRRATRYLARCHRSYPFGGHAPGSANSAGALFFGFAGQTLTGASDGIAPAGGARACTAAVSFRSRGVLRARASSGSPTSSCAKRLLSRLTRPSAGVGATRLELVRAARPTEVQAPLVYRFRHAPTPALRGGYLSCGAFGCADALAAIEQANPVGSKSTGFAGVSKRLFATLSRESRAKAFRQTLLGDIGEMARAGAPARNPPSV